jgi:hypothetical protein
VWYHLHPPEQSPPICPAISREFHPLESSAFHGPCYAIVADVSSVSMNVIPPVVMAGLGGFVLYALYTSQRYRANAIRALATRSGRHYLGSALPRSLTLEGTPFYRISKVSDVIDGEPHGTRIVAFDCQIGVGKGSWRRSVIAVESEANVFGHMLLHPDMTIDRSGRWKIFYRPKAHFNCRIAGLTPVEELEANLNAVVTGSAKTRP